MPTSPTPQRTDFTLDILGRYMCNGLDEALRSADQNIRPDARPFNVLILGGGSFGLALAQHLFNVDKAHTKRILVLEGGPFALPEHVQNLPMQGLNPAPATTTDPGTPRNEVWGLPWRSSVAFPGLAYCIGGRSVFYGGWAPRLLDTTTDVEMRHSLWPQAVRDDLNNTYFAAASEQIGVDVANEFIFGELQNALRQQLFDGINAASVRNAIPLAALPSSPIVPPGTSSASDLQTLLGLNGATGGPTRAADLLNMAKLEPPLAVQGRAPRSGFFPLNKFSSVPLGMTASRSSWAESGGDDVRRRLMIVPNCHVQRLLTSTDSTGNVQVTQVLTNQGPIPVPADGVVVLALATIENARLALTSFPNIPQAGIIGSNLLAHLRSNLTIRIPRTSLSSLSSAVKDLQEAALFVKGRHTRSDGVTRAYFHLQISAAGLDQRGTDAEAQLFKKIPDIDTLDSFKGLTEDHVVITIRGIGEMEPHNPGSNVTLSGINDEYGLPRAWVNLVQSSEDGKLWDAMDQTADDVALVFAGGAAYEVQTPSGFQTVAAGQPPAAVVPFVNRRDGLGTTHHEAGTLAMGDNPATSVTNSDLRFHAVSNAYALGPAVLPTTGSPNPMLTGVALARRLAEKMVRPPAPPRADPGFTLLFDGVSTNGWRMSTITNQPGRDFPGQFVISNGTLVGMPGTDLGLLWSTTPTPADFLLKLEWLSTNIMDNSGVFIRFPNPDSKGYSNTAWVGVDYGFEIQIDQRAMPDGNPIHLTGAVYSFAGPNSPTTLPVKPLGEWNLFEIQVQGQHYQISLNGQLITNFTFTVGGDAAHPDRALPSSGQVPRFIGLQTHTGNVAFRNIQIKDLTATAAPATKKATTAVPA